MFASSDPSTSPAASIADVGEVCELTLWDCIHPGFYLKLLKLFMWKKCSQNIPFSVNQTLGYSGNRKKFSKWHFWDKASPRLFPFSGLPVLMHSHRTGLSPTGLYCEAEKQFWQRLVMQGRPHRCEGWAEKEAFQQEIVLRVLWATSPSFIGWLEMAGPSCP